MLRLIPFAIALTVLTAACVDNPEGPTAPARLVSAEWLEERLGTENLIVIDARPTHEYIEGHLPGAVSASFSEAESTSNGVYVSYGGGLDLWVDVDHPVPFQDASAQEVQEAARSLGIDDGSTVVIYDAGAHFHAARALFTLDDHGLAKVHVLDGGLHKWEALGFETTTEIPEVDRGSFTARMTNSDVKVDTDYVLRGILDPEVQIMHSLPAAWHYGSYLAYSRPGHIPGSTMLPMGYFFRADRTWKSRDELRALFEAQDLDLDRQIVTYCGGNPLSTATYFTAKHVMGLTDVKNYHGSLTAWLEDPRNLPLDTYQHPNWLRDSDWIHWFAGHRIQHLLLDPPALVIDVRDAGAYADGHIAWSVNLPMSDFDDPQLGDVTGWKSRLGALGVGAPIEAVLCDEAITPDVTALFFVLEYLGYPEISVCRDGLAGWTSAGYELTDEETLIAEPTDRIDVAVHPKQFEAFVKYARRVDSLEAATEPPFERVWVVADDEVPPQFESRDHIHMPWSIHFDEDGALRSAAEIWTPYEDAGVGIFSDVAIYAADWKHASVSYFALRLLGLKRVSIYIP